MASEHPSVWDDLNDLIEECWARGEEVAVKLEIVSEAWWSGEIRWTKEPDSRGRPDRSVVFYASAGVDPGSLLPALIEAVRNEIREGRR